jgi:hypothetical protein
VLLIGDTRQHQGVEAGRPFEQLQEAGMRTAELNEIVRQKDGMPGKFCTSECETNWYERSLEWREGRSTLQSRS